MNRCSCCEWIPILPWPVWPLAGHARVGQNTVVGSMMISPLLVVLGSMPRRSMSGPPFPLQPHSTTVGCGATFTSLQAVYIRLMYNTLLDVEGDPFPPQAATVYFHLYGIGRGDDQVVFYPHGVRQRTNVRLFGWVVGV